MNNLLFKFLVVCHRLVKAVANRVLDKKMIRPRNFSNAILARYAPFFSGSMINVSGWKDGDGEGRHYRNYFKKVSRYVVSNVSGQGKGFGSAKEEGYEEVELDLLEESSPELKGAFDVVFNHTTLEHIYDFRRAFKTLCELSRDAVIIVVPVLQQIHHTADFGDYWRPTTMALAKMFLDEGFEPLVIETNDQPFAPVYAFAIAVRDPEKYPSLPKKINFQMGAYNYGSSLKSAQLEALLKKK